jgi:hypothetical protein
VWSAIRSAASVQRSSRHSNQSGRSSPRYAASNSGACNLMAATMAASIATARASCCSTFVIVIVFCIPAEKRGDHRSRLRYRDLERAALRDEPRGHRPGRPVLRRRCGKPCSVTLHRRYVCIRATCASFAGRATYRLVILERARSGVSPWMLGRGDLQPYSLSGCGVSWASLRY